MKCHNLYGRHTCIGSNVHSYHKSVALFLEMSRKFRGTTHCTLHTEPFSWTVPPSCLRKWLITCSPGVSGVDCTAIRYQWVVANTKLVDLQSLYNGVKATVIATCLHFKLKLSFLIMHNGSYLAFNDNTLYAVIDVNGARRTLHKVDN